ncbi:urease accessory protein UreD [Roseateles sp.]|uniref:urease accessory protein UreD n=1 Tax=Roseateles sp. TaxID=1971397 RepID=UPI00286BF39B|nr:urease accessory protein UreD [Roseateles sp.]
MSTEAAHPAGWAGRLVLNYRSEPWHDGGRRTVLHSRHEGPLRVLASLYPEAPSVCHNVLVHPPGGVVGGDSLHIEAELGAGAHALLTTPGATRFYRSAGRPALQSLNARLGAGARLEWLPLETIVHSGALAENQMQFTLAAGAEMLGWDVLALGLPASAEDFERGHYTQSIELPGVWLERARLDATDRALFDSPLGWAGHKVLATLWFGAGTALTEARRTALLDAARGLLDASPLAASAGASSPHAEAVVVRVLAGRVEPVMTLLTQVRAAWRMLAWELEPCAPRIWRC